MGDPVRWIAVDNRGGAGRVALRPGVGPVSGSVAAPRRDGTNTPPGGVCHGNRRSLKTEQRKVKASAGDRAPGPQALDVAVHQCNSAPNPRTTTKEVSLSWCQSSRVATRDGSPMITGRETRGLDGEFDPGSGRTLAACLTHASRAEPIHWQQW